METLMYSTDFPICTVWYMYIDRTTWCKPNGLTHNRLMSSTILYALLFHFLLFSNSFSMFTMTALLQGHIIDHEYQNIAVSFLKVSTCKAMSPGIAFNV